MNIEKIKTLKDLKKSAYRSRSVKEELRENLLTKLKSGEPLFQGIRGYEHTVIPALERAILAGHSINFLGLRGQAKTKMARMMTELLDEYIPVVEGSELNDDPLSPLSASARRILKEKGDDTPISWMHRSERYAEKLATPDVNIADLIGDLDPIKAANLKLSYADEGVIHYGMIPRAHRGIFVINELPDLQPRIQVALFNILQEGDIQIRGFKLRVPLDIQFVFTANPEDYTNRGAIITPLKDRIQSQIFTHYPENIEIGKAITSQEVKLTDEQKATVFVPPVIEDLIEQIAIEARSSEYVDEKSGVSARLTITAYESVVSSVERRMALNNEKKGVARIGDLAAAVPAVVGKIEMVYEGEQEGAVNVAHRLIGAAVRTMAPRYFMDIDQLGNKNKPEAKGRYRELLSWFERGQLDLLSESSEKEYKNALHEVEGLDDAVQHFGPGGSENPHETLMEFLVHSLAEYSVLDKKMLGPDYRFVDYLSSVMPWQE
ncbi:MAG: sigma 54-interacting transcriptional regulator [Flavobacteriales bacterium]|nr:sigma 54-interacting transcriptional regulator [Flavobacteriales bacterium]